MHKKEENLVCRAVVPKPVLEDPCPAPFVCLPYLTHLIPLISSLVETAITNVQLGVSDYGFKMCRAGGPPGPVWEALM